MIRPRYPRASKGPDGMNKTERDFSEILEIRRRAGIIDRWDFEPEKFRLADKTFYTPDFRVIMADMTVVYYEVKGFWEDDARVKIKVAAELHPFPFVAVKLKKGTLTIEGLDALRGSRRAFCEEPEH